MSHCQGLTGSEPMKRLTRYGPITNTLDTPMAAAVFSAAIMSEHDNVQSTAAGEVTTAGACTSCRHTIVVADTTPAFHSPQCKLDGHFAASVIQFSRMRSSLLADKPIVLVQMPSLKGQQPPNVEAGSELGLSLGLDLGLELRLGSGSRSAAMSG